MGKTFQPTWENKTYRVYLTLPTHYWRILQLQAGLRYLEGKQVLEDIVKDWCAQHTELLDLDVPQIDGDEGAETEERVS